MNEEINLKREREAVLVDTKKDAADSNNEGIILNNLFSLVRNGHFDEISAALKKGIDPDIMDDDGNTLLIIACQNNHIEIAKLLLKYGAKIDMMNTNGNMPLHYCSEYGHYTLGRYLILQKANPFIKNIKGIYAYQGSKSSNSTLKNYMLSEKIIKEIKQMHNVENEQFI